MSKLQVKVVIGRFQIDHVGHLSLFRAAAKDCDKLIVVLGSSDMPPNIDNPFSATQRASTIGAMLAGDAEISRLMGTRCAPYFTSVRDYFYTNADEYWIQEVREKVNALIDDDSEVTLVGHHRDSTSYYLDLFPEWGYEEVDEGEAGLNATMIRESLFKHGKAPAKSLSPSTEIFINHWVTTKAYDNLRGDFMMVQKKNRQSASFPYKLTINTADGIVIKDECVLMVIRDIHPGKGQLALPGGHLDVDGDDQLMDAAIRECVEETGVVVTKESCLTDPIFHGVFGHRKRSVRGRYITHAFLWVLPSSTDVVLKGSDEGQVVLWVPLNQIQNKRHMIFEDHAEIIENMITQR